MAAKGEFAAMALKTDYKVQIVIAVLGVLGGISGAVISQWPNWFPPAPSPTVQLGLDYITEGKFKEAVRVLKPFARRGDRVAQYQVGRLYSRGWAKSDDPSSDVWRAIYWLKKAVENGQPGAESELESTQRAVHNSAEAAFLRFIARDEESGHLE
ncbi:hypothetical protein ACIPZ8_21980 [Pseudomonas sp. NPDC089422]|uniref:hypothetical protein n=1 Tax=Pseudomonas sp. NPDC089422 TaxID=3364466 RepID=UPI00381320A2